MGELEQIKVFLAVAEQQGFAAAARQLGMTPASVTRTVAALEERLGVQLLIRTTRQVSLTSAGAVFAARVAPLAEELTAATRDTRDAQGVASGRLRLSAPMSFGEKVLPEVLSRFSQLHPNIRVGVNLTDTFVDINEGEYDLAIRISGPPTDKSTIWRKILPIPRVLVASPAFLEKSGTPETPEDLGGLAKLGYCNSLRPEVWELSKGPARRSLRVEGALNSNNGDLLAKLALNGEGVALLPGFIIREALADGRLVEVLPDWSTPEIWLTLYYPPYDRLPLHVATFSDYFQSCVKDHVTI
ncbi:LysR family transcriptional regulator [Mameliella sediminis]|uniref:LysR family transcriptional regulator n=1 Tax=Mameliella sediminis TaxID=2836866 RepID=UPI001C44B3F2|nr:LysR family transcriptional regulator [Mameliella sediminis]MBV7393224.1 LysR family transcriptional regulator [Mameliella sediminis]